LLNVITILIIAILINDFFTRRRYPLNLIKYFSNALSKPTTTSITLSHSDLEYAIKKINSFIDVTEDDLATIYQLATQHHTQAISLQLEQIQLGHYYSNGLYNKQWSIRLVIAETDNSHDEITYKIISGENRRKIETCTRAEFAQWAKYEVFRNENSWQRVGQAWSD